MTSDETRRQPDRFFRLPGTGMPSTWLCMGCGHKRQPLGSRGVGVFKRCSFCVAAKASGTAVPASLGADSRGGVCAGEH